MVSRIVIDPFALSAGLAAGLILGSFVNTVADRLPSGGSLIRPRSHCPGCERTLAPWELIPVLSFILLRGRCRTCGRPVGWRTPSVELAAGLLGALVTLKLGLTISAAGLGILVLGLLALGIIDLEKGLLPDTLTWPLMAGGLAWSWAGGPGLGWSALGLVVCGGMVWSVGLAYRLLRGYPGLGGGDPKMAALLGAWLGAEVGLLALVSGAGAGALYGLTLVALGRAGLKTSLPLGPFLAFSGVVWSLLRWPF